MNSSAISSGQTALLPTVTREALPQPGPYLGPDPNSSTFPQNLGLPI